MDLDAIHSPWAIRRELLPAIAAIATGRTADRNLEALKEPDAEAALGGPAMQQSVAVISLRGVIMPGGSLLSVLFGGGLNVFRRQLREAVNSDEVGAIVLDVNSPGGSIALITETAADIRAAAEQKKVVAVANTTAASAAYWLASQASELVATPSARIGSVGVYMLHEDWSGYNERVGIDPTYIYAGKYKVDGNPDEPLSESAKEEFQARVDEGLDEFAADVAKGRGVTPAVVKGERFGQGRLLGAKDAVKQGMADRVETLEEAVGKLARGGRRATGGRHAEGLQFTDHIASVVAEVDDVIDRTADVVAKRAEKGKTLGSESQDLLTELDARLDRLKGLLACEPDNDNDDVSEAAEQEFLRFAEARAKEE
jgi:signal peptide peptidase SppA